MVYNILHESTAVSTLGERYQKLTFYSIQAMVFLQSYVTMLGGCLGETENKRIC